MKKPFLILLLLLVSVLDLSAQTDEEYNFRKIDISVNFNLTGKTNYSKPSHDGNTLKSTQSLFVIYPLQHRRIQFGLAAGYENVQTAYIDSFAIHEGRIPLLVATKFNITKGQELYFKAQFGTALTTKSELEIEGGGSLTNSRNDIGAPIIANLGIGINLPLNDIGVGFEFGYSYKQLGYKLENNYPNGAIFLGIMVSFP